MEATMALEDPIISVDGNDVSRLKPDAGGVRLTKLMDSIVRVQCHFFGIPASAVQTNIRTDQPDGGVDTRVRASIGVDPDGWMTFPTVWQYKSTSHREVSSTDLEDEVNKTFAVQCIKDGDAYRLCISDSMPIEKKQKWETELLGHVRKLNPAAPVPLVLAADDIAAWASKFPGIVLSSFRSHLSGRCLSFERWGQQATATTREYVAIGGWAVIQEALLRHLDFSTEVPEVVFPLQGEAGVGKSRFVYEALRAVRDASALTLYAIDNHEELIRILIMEDRRVIVVADECPLNTRMALKELAKAHRRSVRIVTIDNSGDRPVSGTPERWLTKATTDERERILDLNYPEVPQESRRRYAALSGGFVRLAADMCQNHAQIVAEGHHRSVIESVRDYYRSRLNADDRRYMEAIALFDKVGFKDDKAQEFAKVCELTGTADVAKARETLLHLHDVPGFIAVAGRFMYVTPEIVAEAAFYDAYQRWFRHDGEGFLRRIPGELLDRFLSRARKSTVKEVHELVANFFRTWALTLQVSDLHSYDKVTRLITLAENDPEMFVPIVVSLVERATPADIPTREHSGGRWGPIREIVWFAERLAQFPEFFGYAERILLHLAVLNTEPDISNNAEGIWKHVFRIGLSGTATPFEDRLKLLRERIFNTDEAVSTLALTALDRLFDRWSVLTRHQAVIAGREPPAGWGPATWDLYSENERWALTTLSELLQTSDGRLRKRGIEILINNVRSFLQHGFLPEVRAMLERTALEDELRAQLLVELSSYLHFAAEEPSRYPPGKHTDEVRALEALLTKTDFHGRLVTLVAVDPWRASLMNKEPDWQSELKKMAQCLLEDEDLLLREVGWLFSSGAKAAVALGEQLGRLDQQGKLLETLIKEALGTKRPALTRGYLIGAMPTLDLKKVNALFDEVEGVDPAVAFDLFIVGGRATHSLERTLRLIDAGKLKLRYLRVFELGIDRDPLTIEELQAVLSRLKTVMPGDTEASDVAIELLAYRTIRGDASIIDVPEEIAALVWEVLALAAEEPSGQAFWWGQLLQRLSEKFPARVASLAAKAMVSGSFSYSDTAEEILTQLAQSHPAAVMEEIGKLMLDEQQAWTFFAAKFHIFAKLPEEVVMAWLTVNGVEAARTIARHLPAPTLDAAGSPLLPPLTEFVLSNFGDDERVFVEFAAGVHSLQTYMGDIASIHDREGLIASKFLTHPIVPVQRWARIELEESRKQADDWRRRQEEGWSS
jgi:hypothetical protein